MQLRDLPIDKRIKAINVKSCLAYENYLESLKSCDFDTLKKGVKALLEIEPEFFLIDEEFLDSVIEIISIYNDTDTLVTLLKLKKLSTIFKEKRRDRFLEREYVKRNFIKDYEDYLELLELDDLLISEENYNCILDNPYILQSISYLKREFSDYYAKNRKADNYLLTILNILKKRYYDIGSSFDMDSIFSLFPNHEKEKIITFAKKVQE